MAKKSKNSKNRTVTGDRKKANRYKSNRIPQWTFELGNISSRLRNVYLFLSLWLINMLWWDRFKNYKFVQDDLILFPYFQNDEISFLTKIFGGAEIANRWRPITNFFTWLVIELIGTNHFMWFVFNVSLIALTGFMVAHIVQLKTNQIWLSWLVGFAIVTSRFQTGLVTQATFIVENVANLFFALLLGVLVLKVKFSQMNLFGIVGLFGALLLTHERYITLGLPIVVMIYLKSVNARHRILGISLTTLIAFFYLLIKKFVLVIPLFVGTGSAWKVGFSFETFIRHTSELIVGILGVNLGSPSLNGHTFQNQNLIESAASVTIVILCIATIWNRTIKICISGISKKIALESLFPISLFVALAIPIVSTSRIEQRWFLATYITFLFYFVPKMQNGLKQKTLRVIYATLILSVFMNFAYLKKTDQIYFNQDSLSAEANSKVFIDSQSGSIGDVAKVAIVSNEDTKAFDLWYRNFFEINYPEIEFNPSYFSSLSDAIQYSKTVSILELKGGMLSNLQKNFESEGYLLTGSYWLDGWVGERFSITVSKQECPVIEINFLGSMFKNSVEISNTNGFIKSWDNINNPSSIQFKIQNSFDVFDFSFEKIYIPKALGINADVRSLSTRMSFRCQK